jgi:hypothetical protein
MSEQDHRIIIFTEVDWIQACTWGWMCAVDKAEGVGFEDRDAAESASQEHVR